MKAQFKSRPQSKHLSRGSARPTSRYINTEQAKKSFDQGKQEQSKEQYQKAIEQYVKAVMYDPNYFQAYCNMGSCYRALKDYHQSKRNYKKAIAIKRDDAISHYNLANVLRLLGDYESSIDHYTFVIDLKEQKNQQVGSLYLNSLINMGICYKCKLLFEKATDCYEKALKVDPKEVSILFNYGMNISHYMNSIDPDVFQAVIREKATKAKQLFQQYNELNKGNPMIDLQLLRMSVFLDRSSQHINQVIETLNAKLKEPNCDLQDQIHSELGNCHKLLQKYQESSKHYRQSLSNFNQKRPSQVEQNVYDMPGDAVKMEKQPSQKNLTEAQGIKMLEEGLFEQVEARIVKMDENDPAKHVLELALQLCRVNEDKEHLKRANTIFTTYFKKPGTEFNMENISIEGHKVIGQLLSFQGRFKESIKHFEYVSAKLSNEEEKMRIHSSMGNDYEAMGDISKALQEYKLALSSQPNNYQLHYNIGCCCFQDGAYQQAIKYFQTFLQLIKNDNDTKMEIKNLYTTDCLISMASCRNQLQVNKLNVYDYYLRAWKALKQIQAQASEDSPFDYEAKKIQSFHLQWAQILEEKLGSMVKRKGEEYITTKQTLLEVYLFLLQNQNCPDRDAILSNSATMFYEQKLYINSLLQQNQISSDNVISFNNMALTYLHLHQHYMACKLLYMAAEDNFDVIQTFNKGIFNWIYGLPEDQNQSLTERFQNQSDEAMFARLEYGKMVIDAATACISDLDEGAQLGQLQGVVQQAQHPDALYNHFDQHEHPKIKALTNILAQKKSRSKDNVDTSDLELSLKTSNNPSDDFGLLLNKYVENRKDTSQAAVQVLFDLFIFNNLKNVSMIKEALTKVHKQNKQQAFEINLDRRVTIIPQLLSKTFGTDLKVKNIDDLINHLIVWESELQEKLIVVMKTIERLYYKSNFRKPMEYDYQFPRHNAWEECPSTFLKIALAVKQLTKNEPIQLKGKTLSEMKKSVYGQLQVQLMKVFSKGGTATIALNDKFSPVAAYCYFSSQQACMQFLRQLQKESSSKQNINIASDCKELVVNVNGLVKLSCQWQEPNPFLSVVRSLCEHPLNIEAQAVVSLGQDIEVLKINEGNRKLIEAHPFFKKL